MILHKLSISRYKKYPFLVFDCDYISCGPMACSECHNVVWDRVIYLVCEDYHEPIRDDEIPGYISMNYEYR